MNTVQSDRTRAVPTAIARPVVLRTKGVRHGPITRLMSPGDLGQMLKPFVFLDLFEADRVEGPGFAPHPHSGIATLTTFLEGRMSYADSTGKEGSLSAGAVEWMRAGSGVWHAGEPAPGQPMRGYQLWVALSPELELASPESLYLEPGRIAESGGVRVLLGTFQGVESPIPFDGAATYLHVRLRDGQRWTFRPDSRHDIAWLALNRGKLRVGGVILEREVAVFAEGGGDIEVLADGEAEFVIGSAARHPHALVTGYYSVHTSAETLAEGERTIARLRTEPAVARLHGRRA